MIPERLLRASSQVVEGSTLNSRRTTMASPQEARSGPADGLELIELAGAEIGRVKAAPRRWTSMGLAVFAAVTCVGLAAPAVLPGRAPAAAEAPDGAAQRSAAVPAVTAPGSTPPPVVAT